MENKDSLFTVEGMTDEELFARVDHNSLDSEKITAPRYSYWRSVFRVFFKKKINIFVLAVLAWKNGLYPAFITIDDKSRLEFVKTCKQNDLIPLYAAVGYRSYDEERAKARLLLRGDIFITTFPGFIVLKDGETQSFDIKEAEMFRP